MRVRRLGSGAPHWVADDVALEPNFLDMDISVAVADDLSAFLELAAEVEHLFGPMVDDVDFHDAVRRNIARGTALLARDSLGRGAGGILFSAHHPTYLVGWLVVANQHRSRGLGGALLAEAFRRWVQPSCTIEVVAFGPDHPGARSRRFYERLGFEAAEQAERGPEGGSRQVFRMSLARLPDWVVTGPTGGDRGDGVEIVDTDQMEFRGVHLLVETILGTQVPVTALVTTGFCLAFDDAARLLMVRLADRDWHPTGGHLEDHESPEQAAVRETAEEGGCLVSDLVAVGVQRLTALSHTPADWPYPVPVGYQVFFTRRLGTSEPRPGTEAVEAALFGEAEARRTGWVERHTYLYDRALAVHRNRSRPSGSPG